METLSREDIAKREIGNTDISSRLARAMTLGFLFLIGAVPVAQMALELSSEQGRVHSLTIFKAIPEAADAFLTAQGGPYRKTLQANARLLQRIRDYESEMDSTSLLTRTLLGRCQLLLSRYLGQGNEKAYLGRRDWLFFRPDVDHVMGPPFLDAARLRRRSLTGNEFTPSPQPDPRQAIIDFHRQLRARGITLVVVPTPTKVSLHPDLFSPRFTIESPPVENESTATLLHDLEAAGVRVFDPSAVLREAIAFNGMPQYLKTDTHWTPSAMEHTAARLADSLRAWVGFSQAGRTYIRTPVRVTQTGDIAVMMKLPAGQTLFPPESVSIMQVSEERSGAPWRAVNTAEILLLGDSFSNIYSLGTMGWGQSGGFAEQLSYYLQQPVYAIVQNDAGAHATRQALAARLTRGDDVLAGKRVVIWQFASRELSLGDWKIIPLP